ncbi:MAG: enoyl-CoA hydratase-related protein [Polaromonas sp.]|nr:enoyl-CoA hydratase-related protein [Polaromonas sp.]
MSHQQSEESVLRQTIEEGVCWLTLNRPQRANALNTALRNALLGAVREAMSNKAVKVLVLDSSGSAFCAGSDIDEIIPSPAHIDRVRGPNTELLALLRNGPKPTIAVLRGVAAGIGLSLALACDLRFASPRAGLLAAFGRLGLTADGGLTSSLIRTMGFARGMEMLYTERKLTAAEALDWGAVNAVVQDNDLTQYTLQQTRGLSGRSSDALAAMKAAMNLALTSTFDEMVQFEFDQQAELMGGSAFHDRFKSLRKPG